MDYTKISNVVIGGIDYNDAPDFCDAYIESADYDGEDMSEDMLEELNQDEDFVYEQIQAQLY
jgi:hypothetical protein